MAYQIEYAYTCHIGKIRNNNEDNFWCCGEFLNAQNSKRIYETIGISAACCF